jgi:hypothetical protein
MDLDRHLRRSIAGRRRIIIFSLLALMVLLAIFLLSNIDLDLVLRWSDRVAVLPTARAEYQHLVDKIASATSDDLLEDEMNEMPRLYRASAGCIAAQGSRTYGTNRSQADIQQDYVKAFAPMKWEFGATGAGFKTFGTSTKTTSVMLVFVEPISPDFSIGKGRYQIIYRVDTIYSDPQIFGRFG